MTVLVKYSPVSKNKANASNSIAVAIILNVVTSITVNQRALTSERGTALLILSISVQHNIRGFDVESW